MDINSGVTMRIWGFEPHAVLSRTIHGIRGKRMREIELPATKTVKQFGL